MKANKDHVETNATAFFRMNPGLTKGKLFIDYPTGACSTCKATLPDMLPAGTRLWLLSPYKTEFFEGLADPNLFMKMSRRDAKKTRPASACPAQAR
ncbi:DddA-like double-stranded DNA deaminase toxin [Kitasatospora sp. NPDC086801]|uniref:DddA-like double-stranded DNA deaminase toxin n=1 Tax=Kitasatospora sp. NPDC086801 TaxID=3364066 RepID=UPI003825B6C1